MAKEVKASFVYSLGEMFGWEVGFRDICASKAGAYEEEYPVHGKSIGVMVVSSSVARRYILTFHLLPNVLPRSQSCPLTALSKFSAK